MSLAFVNFLDVVFGKFFVYKLNNKGANTEPLRVAIVKQPSSTFFFSNINHLVFITKNTVSVVHLEFCTDLHTRISIAVLFARPCHMPANQQTPLLFLI